MMKTYLLLLTLPIVAAAQPALHSYVGAGGCSSSNCHGGTSPLDQRQSRILGNEFATWSALDKHSRAFLALSLPRSKRMGEILKLTPTTDSRCTVCHVVGSPEKSLSDGVACEACHGPASDWLGSHLQVKSQSAADIVRTHMDSVQKGMIDTKKLDVRANLCLACHLGQGSRQVDHEMIAAGHPDLAFELDTFTAGEPAHHRDPKPAVGNALPRVRAWAVGQSAALAEGMRLLSAHTDKNWPEFSDLECYQCHHDLLADSWRIQRGYGNRKPGSLQVNLARVEVMRELVAVAAPEQAAAFEGEISRLASIVSERVRNASAIGQAASAVERTANRLTAQFMSQDFDAPTTIALIRAFKRNIQRIANAGVNSAEQATMSLDALTTPLWPQNAPRLQAITDLYTYLEHPSVYDPGKFVTLYQKAAPY